MGKIIIHFEMNLESDIRYIRHSAGIYYARCVNMLPKIDAANDQHAP